MLCPIDCSKARFAVAVVREAAQLVRRVQKEMLVGSLNKGALAKDDKSPVTVADFAAQALVGLRLSETFPAMGFVGEESAEVLRTPEGQTTLEQITHFVQQVVPTATSEKVCEWIDRGAGEPTNEFWTLDPVDGTKGFLRGDQYAVALGFIRNGEVRVGALGCPELADASRPDKGGPGTLLVARRGNGTWAGPLDATGAPDTGAPDTGAPDTGDHNADDHNAGQHDSSTEWRLLKTSGRTEANDARLLCSFEKAHTDTGGIGLLIKTLGITADPVPMDSQAKYSLLAAGVGDVNLRLLSPSNLGYREKIWDQAAGSIVVEEAGGRITDLDGKPLDFSYGSTLASNRGILATNGHLHDALLAGLQKINA